MKFNLKIILLSTSTVFTTMLLYESAKEFMFKGALSPWQSHWITICFTTLLSLIIVLLTMNKILTFQEQELSIILKEEKLKSIKQTMTVVHHRVNNLAANLQLAELEIEDRNTIDQETLKLLKEEIQDVVLNMKELGEIEDPYNDKLFALKVNSNS